MMVDYNTSKPMIYNKSSENMSEIADKSAHLIVTSPPYPMIEKWDELFGKTDFWGQHSILGNTWRECDRILADGGIACINIGDATRTVDSNFCCYPNYAATVLMFAGMHFTPLIPIFWKKISNRPNAFLGSGFLPPNGYVSQDCEYIAILRKGTLRRFKANDENRKASAFTKPERDLWFQQIWEIPGARGAKGTSAFPYEIPMRLIRMFSLIGETVVDPFCGSGTTGRAAETWGRNFIGYTI